MLAANEKRLRWWGMDMRPCWRRRVAVVVTYMAFLAAISFSDQPWWGHPMITTMTLLSLAQFVGIFRGGEPLKSFEGLVKASRSELLDERELREWAVQCGGR